jgi:hypothetical protein
MVNQQFGTTGALFAAFVMAGCAASEAVESRPADMSVQGHCEARARETAEAAYHWRAAQQVQPSKPAVEYRQRAEHELAAKRHDRYAEQHTEAARIAARSAVQPCRTW